MFAGGCSRSILEDYFAKLCDFSKVADVPRPSDVGTS